MDRVQRTYIVPDVLPEIDPTVDLQIKLSAADGTFKTVKPDTLLQPEQVILHFFSSAKTRADLFVGQTLQEPTVVPRILHGESKLYTLAIVDPGMCRFVLSA